jgi:hypothetical protein
MLVINIYNTALDILLRLIFVLKRGYAEKVLRKELKFFTITGSNNKYKYFYHSHNIGNLGLRYSERVVELSLSDRWLASNPDAIEIGAVTPYYWPGRVNVVVDPSDQHHLVTERQSLFDLDCSGKNVLMISTIEHIGLPEYNQREKLTAVDAFLKIAKEAENFLITFPVGWNALLDEFVFSGNAATYCTVRFLVRNRYELWDAVEAPSARIQYGDNRNPWANSLVIMERGNAL